MPLYEISAPNGKRYRIEGPPDASDEDVARAVIAQFPEAANPPPKTTIGGYAREALKAVPRGLVGGLESAALGAAALLPGDTEGGFEKTAREGIKGLAERLKPTAAAGYEESPLVKVMEGVGSFGSLLIPGGIGGMAARGLGASARAGQLAAAAPVATAMGAGEARERAVAEGATPEQITKATQLGMIPGIAELAPVERVFRVMPQEIKGGIFDYVKRALVTGGVEGAQEAASAVAQNLIARGVYKPSQELIEGVGENAAYGAGAGAIVQFLLDSVAGRRARPVAPPQPQPPAAAPQAIEQPVAPAPRTDAEVALTQMQQAQAAYDALPIDDPRRVELAGEIAKYQDQVAQIDAAKAQESAFAEQMPDLFGMYTAPKEARPEFELEAPEAPRGEQLELPLEQIPEPTRRGERDLFTPPEPFKITDQKLTELGFSKTSKKARDALRGLDLTKATDLERFDEITQDLSGKVKFNPDAVGAVIQQAQESLAVQKTKSARPQLLGGEAMPDQTAVELMFAQQRRNEGLPLTDRQKFLLRNQPTPEIITPTAPAAQPLEVVTSPERKPGGQFLTPTDIPKPLQEPVAAVQPEEAQKRRRSKSMPTRQMGLDFEGAPDDTGRQVGRAGVVPPVSQPEAGVGPVGGVEPAGVAGTERDVGRPAERERTEQPALEAPTIDKPTARSMLKEQGVPTPEINRIVKAYDEPTGFAAAEFKEAFDRGDFLKLKGPQVGAALPNTVADRLQTQDLKGALRTLSETGSTPVIRTVARKLLPAIRKTNIVNQAAPDGSPAAYDRATDTIYLDPSVHSEHALLHEATHAAIAHVLDNKLNPLTQKLQKLFDSLAQDIKNTYGATNLQEFAAEAMSNSEFQAQLRGQPKNWWGRFVDAIRGFLGLSKAKQVEKTLDQILDIAPAEGRDGVGGVLGMNFEQKSGYSFDPSAYRPSVVSWAKERFGDMVAPNGKPAWQNFVRWFGDSKVVDAEGRPLVVYTGTSKDLDFVSFRIPKNGAWFTLDPDAASMYAKDNDSMGYRSEGWNLVPINTASRVIPSFLNISKPYKLTAADLAQINKENYKRAQAQLFDTLRAKGYDGVDLGGGVLAAIGKPTQIKSAVGNVGTFDPTKPQILRLETAAPQSFEGNIKKIVADTPQPQAVASRAFDKVMSWLDAAYPAQEAMRKAMRTTGRTANEIAVGLGLFAQAGHFGAVSARGLQKGGMKYDPAVGNFVATDSEYNMARLKQVMTDMGQRYGLSNAEVDTVVNDALEGKRLLSIYAERDSKLQQAERLAALGNKKAAKKLRDEWEEMPFHMSREEAKQKADLFKQYPELKQIEDIKNGMRGWVVKFLTDMGLISQEKGETWLDNAEWIPFQREFDSDETASMEQFAKHRMGIQATARNPKYKGSLRPVEPVLENFEKWIMHSLRMGMREGFTKAAVAEFIKSGQAKPDSTKGARGTESRRVKYHVDGQPRYALFDDPSIAAFYNSNVVPPKVSGLISGFNALFRKSIIGLPTFAVKQLIVDSMEAIQKSGLPPRYAMRIPIEAAKEFMTLTFKGTTPTYEKLTDRGFAGPFTDLAAVQSEELKKLGYGVKDETQRNAFMRGLQAAELFGMRTAMHSDNAIRAALYKISQEAGMNQAQSYNLAADYINFRRQVNSDLLRMFVAYVPFSGAAMAAVRSSLMAISGKGLTPQERNQAFRNYAANMALLTTISMLMAMANEEDEEYRNMSPEQRARQITIPGTGGVGIPRRVSIETLFPILAEMMTNQATSNAVDATQLKRVLVGLGMEALAPVPMPMPAPIKTAVEQATNYNFFTGEPIVGYGMSRQEAWKQYGASTSSVARSIGEALNEAGLGNTPFASPTRVDHVVRGLLGSLGSGMLMLSNMVASKVGDRPAMTANEILTSIPGFTMPAAREFNLAARNDFYDLAERMDKVASTANALLKEGRIEEYRDYVEKNATKIGMDKAINRIMPQLRKIRDAMRMVRESDMPDKDERLRQLRQMEMNFIRSLNVPELRRMAGL